MDGFFILFVEMPNVIFFFWHFGFVTSHNKDRETQQERGYRTNKVTRCSEQACKRKDGIKLKRS